MRKALAFIWTWLAAAAFLPAGAEAQIAIGMGETITIAVDANGQASVVERSNHPTLSEFTREAGRRIANGDYPEAVGSNYVEHTPTNLGVPEPPPVVGSVLRITFVAPDGRPDHSFLVLENGFDGALTYRARIRVGERTAVTDVCQVPPMSRGDEHWPFHVDEIILSDFSLRPWHQNDRVRCE